MAMTPEGRVKKRVRSWLEDHGAYYYMPVSNGMGRVGAPDFLVCLPGGRFVGIETKAPGRRSNTTPNQRREIDAILAAGGTALVVDDVAQLEPLKELVSPPLVSNACSGPKPRVPTRITKELL